MKMCRVSSSAVVLPSRLRDGPRFRRRRSRADSERHQARGAWEDYCSAAIGRPQVGGAASGPRREGRRGGDPAMRPITIILFDYRGVSWDKGPIMSRVAMTGLVCASLGARRKRGQAPRETWLLGAAAALGSEPAPFFNGRVVRHPQGVTRHNIERCGRAWRLEVGREWDERGWKPHLSALPG